MLNSLVVKCAAPKNAEKRCEIETGSQEIAVTVGEWQKFFNNGNLC